MAMNVNQEQIRANLLSTTFWVRVLFMVIFALVLWALWLALIVICSVQTVIVLITGEVNEQLKRLGGMASEYLRQIVDFMVFASEEKPFPFSPMPEQSDASSDAEVKTGTVMPAESAPAAKPDMPVLSDSATGDPKPEEDDQDDSFYDPERDSGATR